MSLYSQVFSQSSLVPLAKIASAPTRFQRILWVIVTTAMFLGLCICIALVTHQYSKHQTVFQLDYSGRHFIYDQTPGITICQDPTEMLRLFAHASRRYGWPQVDGDSPWGNVEVNVELLKLTTANGTRPSGAIGHHLPIGQLMWDTETSAKSPLYRMLHNFKVTFHIKSANLKSIYQLFVLEQIPNSLNFMCTTFELTTQTPEEPWSYVEIKIEQDMKTGAIATDTVDSTEPKGATFVIITHERGELPFSAYDRNIYTPVAPSSFVSLYYSKMVTKRANTVRNPCHAGADSEWLAKSVQSLSADGTHFYDYLDQKRLGIKKRIAWPTGNLPYLSQHSTDSTKGQQSNINAKTVTLFNTDLLYTREACAWAFCCMKVAEICNCTCMMDWSLSTGTKSCPKVHCERTQCSDSPIPYEQCPIPCSIAKFIKQNLITVEAPESDLLPNGSLFKIIRSENVQVAAEEEIYSLAKLFSEIGGLCSLFIGFSCIFIFELLEAMLLLKRGKTQSPKAPEMASETQVYCCSGEMVIAGKSHKSSESPRPSEQLTNENEQPPENNALINKGCRNGEEKTDIYTIPVFLRVGPIDAGPRMASAPRGENKKSYLFAESEGFTKSQLLNLMQQGRLRFRLMSGNEPGSHNPQSH